MAKRLSSASIRRMTRQPGWWAAAASLGFHGLLFTLLPLLPTPPSFGDDIDARTVSVLELSTTDTERLPNFLDEELTPPPVPGAPLPENGQPLQIEPYGDLGPNLVESLEQWQQSQQSRSSVSPGGFYTLPPNFTLRNNSQNPPPADLPSLNPAPPSTDSEKILPPEEIQPDDPTDALSRLEPDDPPEEPPAEASPPPEEPPQESPPPEPPPEPKRIALSEEQQEAYRRLYSHSGEGTSGNEAQLAALEWLTEGLGFNIDEAAGYRRDILQISISYPEDACVITSEDANPPATPAVYGIVLNESGSVTEEPVLLRSSGYGVLNLEGGQAVAAQTFDASGPKLVEVKFRSPDETCSAPEAIAREQAGQGQTE